jgi:hypothetical protein
MNACKTKITQLHVIDVCMNVIVKIMMYNFNMRRNIAQQEKKRKRQNEYRMCKRKENNQQRHRQTERKKKFLFTLVNENTHDIQIEHTLLFQARQVVLSQE